MQTQPTRSDWYIIALFYVIAIPVTFSGYDYSIELLEAIADTVIYVIFTFAVSYIIVYRLFPHFFPEKRIIVLFFCTALLMIVLGTLEILLYQIADGQKQWWRFLKNYQFPLWAISTSAQNAGIMVGVLLGKKFYDVQLEIQQQEKEKKESELRLLKSQVDPHFLFNNLNTVDSLIDKDPKIAKEYINHLSRLYRYLTKTKDDEVVLLEDEFEFAKNYIFLIEKRFGSSYSFKIELNTTMDNKLIPPGAIQAALENVVKHNASSPTEKIQTHIAINEDHVVIRNNVNEKTNRNISTGTGLTNLQRRYSFLTDVKLDIQKGKTYTIRLPLIDIVD